MTGALVKLGQRLAAALVGGPRWQWAPYLALWGGLIAGAAAGALAYPRAGMASLWIAVAAAWLLCVYAALLGPAERLATRPDTMADRKSGVEGKRVAVRVDLGGRRLNKKKK